MRLKPKTPMDYHKAEQPDAVLADLEAKHGSTPARGSADSSQHCGRWVFQRPNISDWMVYLVRTPEGHIKRDYGIGQANAFGEIFAWLEMYPEPPYPPNEKGQP